MVDIEALAKDPGHRTLLLDRAMRTHDMDNERFLRKVREGLDRCAGNGPHANIDPYANLAPTACHAKLRVLCTFTWPTLALAQTLTLTYPSQLCCGLDWDLLLTAIPRPSISQPRPGP